MNRSNYVETESVKPFVHNKDNENGGRLTCAKIKHDKAIQNRRKHLCRYRKLFSDIQISYRSFYLKINRFYLLSVANESIFLIGM